VLHERVKSRGLAVVVVVNNFLRIKAWVGLGRFVLQSYEKSELEVEPGCTEHAARRKVPSHQKGVSASRLENSCTRKQRPMSACLFPSSPWPRVVHAFTPP
jgi:hypothetical protein